MKEYKLTSIKKIDDAARWVIKEINEYTVILIDGEMGAGKTTLIKEIGKQLGVKDVINSPTFSIINEYKTNQAEIIYHFDCYRINSDREAIEIGIPDYLYSGKLCFIEWGENIKNLLPENQLMIKIIVNDKNVRSLQIYNS